jgi:hypothetical protein
MIRRLGVPVRFSWVLALILSLSMFTVAPAGAQVRSQPSKPTEPSLVPTAPPPWLEGWAGFGFQNNWYGGYLGVVAALNETHNVWADGWVLRGEGVLGHYDYNDPNYLGTGQNVNVTYSEGAAYLGYRKNVNGLGMVTGYVGVDVIDHNNPDPNASTRGTNVGVKFLGEIYNQLNPTADFYGMASFSTAFDTWFMLARPGFLVTPVGSGFELRIGPEGQALGNGYGIAGSCTGNSGSVGSCRWDEGRVGAFAHFKFLNQPYFGDWIVSGGYRAPLLHGNSADGYYTNITTNFKF